MGVIGLPISEGWTFHPYHLDESTFIFRGIRSIFFFHFSMKFIKTCCGVTSGAILFAFVP